VGGLPVAVKWSESNPSWGRPGPENQGLPAVGDAAAVAPHAQALLQVRGEARGGDASTAVGTHALLVLPLVVHLAKHVHPRLVHDFCTIK